MLPFPSLVTSKDKNGCVGGTEGATRAASLAKGHWNPDKTVRKQMQGSGVVEQDDPAHWYSQGWRVAHSNPRTRHGHRLCPSAGCR